jgi:hypothetical protein
MRCEVIGCASEAAAHLMVRQQDDYTTVGISLCLDHKRGIDSGALLVDRRTAQGRFELMQGPVAAVR